MRGLGSVEPGDHVLAKVRGSAGQPQWVELLCLEVVYDQGACEGDCAAAGRFVEARHVGASDGYVAWYAQAVAHRGGRGHGTLHHLFGRTQEQCEATCPDGAGGIEHLDVWRLVNLPDLEEVKEGLELAPRSAGGLRVATGGSGAGAGAPGLASEAVDLERALEDPELGDRPAQLGQRLRSGVPAPSGRAAAENAAAPGAARALANRAHAAAGSTSRPAATAGCDRLAEAIDGLLRGQVVEVSDLPRQELKARTIAFRDGHWRSARWLTLIPSESMPAGATQTLAGMPVASSAEALSILAGRVLSTASRQARGKQSATQRAQADRAPAAGAGEPPARLVELRTDSEASAAAQTRRPAQPRHQRKLLAGVGNVSIRFQLIAALYDAAHGAPGDVGRFIRSAPPAQRVRLERDREELPLPVPDSPDFLARRAEWLSRGEVSPDGLGSTVAEGWTVLIVHAVNSQCAGHSKGRPVPTGAAARRAGDLHAGGQGGRGLPRAGRSPGARDPDWNEVVASGDLPLTLGGVLPGLLARGVAASVRALDTADERAAGWLAEPTFALPPKAEWPEEVPRAASQACSKPEWYRIAAKLGELGPAAPTDDERILKVGSQKVLVGAFGVAKSGTPTPGHAVVQRPIINMVPANSYQRAVRDGIGTFRASP
ncbi:unnamed protein product, partial [Prorocentrum cordatum]